jgi:hypothetical protein
MSLSTKLPELDRKGRRVAISLCCLHHNMEDLHAATPRSPGIVLVFATIKMQRQQLRFERDACACEAELKNSTGSRRQAGGKLTIRRSFFPRFLGDHHSSFTQSKLARNSPTRFSIRLAWDAFRIPSTVASGEIDAACLQTRLRGRLGKGSTCLIKTPGMQDAR